MPREGYIGSSEAPALLHRSPYKTRFQLWARETKGIPIAEPDHERLYWGLALQDDIISYVVQEMRWDIEPNAGDKFVVHPDPQFRAGSTVDAWIRGHKKGLGIVEAKARDWMRLVDEGWTDTAAPDHVEIQLQQQLWTTGASWGVIALLINGNDVRLYERDVMPDVRGALEAEHLSFWNEVETGKPPAVVGIPEELPTLAALYPEVVENPILDLRGDADFALLAAMAAKAKLDESVSGKVWKEARTQILARTENHAVVRTNGFKLKIRKTPVRAGFAELDEDIKLGLDTVREYLLTRDEGADAALVAAIEAAIRWRKQTRAASVQQVVEFERVDGDPEIDTLANIPHTMGA